MTTQPNEAVGNDANAPVDAKADALKAFEDMADSFFDDEEQPAEGEGEEPEITDEAEDEPQIEEEEDELPPIEPPVSWDADAKEVFKGLPRDAQEIVQKREAERERFVQQKSQEATRARQDAEQTAIQQLAQIEHGYAQHFQQLAEQLQPQRPNPALLQHDPVAYYAQRDAYESAVAQQQQLQQHAQTYASQAQARAAQIEQAEHAEQHRILVEHFPEYTDPTTGPELQRKLTSAAKRIGYSDELIGQARATDILAMRAVADAFDKADKYDALQKTKMEKVRAARGKPPVSARPGVAVAPDQSRMARSTAAFERAKAGRNMNEKAEGFAEWAKLNGLV
jgi:hypothetical protein